jgi:hypothetical protein
MRMRHIERPFLALLLVVLFACQKDEEEYLRGIRYEATCDECQVCYVVGTTKIYTVVNGHWDHFFRVYQAQYLSVQVIDGDTLGTSTAKVLVNGTLTYSASNTGALDTAVVACGYP